MTAVEKGTTDVSRDDLGFMIPSSYRSGISVRQSRENPFEERYRWFESGSLQRRVVQTIGSYAAECSSQQRQLGHAVVHNGTSVLDPSLRGQHPPPSSCREIEE